MPLSNQDEFIFTLSKPVKYHARVEGGEGCQTKESNQLILRAPSFKHHYRIGNVLHAMFIKGIISMSEGKQTDSKQRKKREKELEALSEEKRKEEELKEKRIMVPMGILSLGAEINDFYDRFETLLLSEKICFVDEKEAAFTEMELNDLDYNDFKKLVEEYIVNFFIVSWMSSLGQN